MTKKRNHKKNMKEIGTLLNAKSSEELKKEIDEEMSLPDPAYSLAQLLEEEKELEKQDAEIHAKNEAQKESKLIDIAEKLDEKAHRIRY